LNRSEKLQLTAKRQQVNSSHVLFVLIKNNKPSHKKKIHIDNFFCFFSFNTNKQTKNLKKKKISKTKNNKLPEIRERERKKIENFLFQYLLYFFFYFRKTRK
jgi:hypothetical protein